MKTPDEIKKALKLCGRGCYSGCPYKSFECVEELSRDGLEYIHRLEHHIGELTEKVAQLEEECDLLIADLRKAYEELPEPPKEDA